MSTTVLGERNLSQPISQVVAKEPRAGRSDKEKNINLNLLNVKFLVTRSLPKEMKV